MLVNSEEEYNQYACDKCFTLFWCDPHTQNNMHYNMEKMNVFPKCPSCGFVEYPDDNDYKERPDGIR